MPAFILGLAIIRGEATPVLDLGSLVSASGNRLPATRYVTVKVGVRHAALAVDAVVGIRALPPGLRSGLPPLCKDVRADFVASIATLDGNLLLVLESAKLVPAEVWNAIDAAEPRP